MTRPSIPTAQDARESLREHIHTKATQARLIRGGYLDLPRIMLLLEDRTVVRYPVGIRFDPQPLAPGEFACLEPLGSLPADGYCLFIHPTFELAVDLLPLLIAYYIPSINYGDVVSHEDAELFGATLLGIEQETYYATLCAAADSLSHDPSPCTHHTVRPTP